MRKIRHFSFVLLLLIVTALSLTACGSPESAEPTEVPAAEPTPIPEPSVDEVTLTDGLGREVTIVGAPQRIVSLAPSTAEILYAVGAGDRLVGRDEFSDYPPEILDVESIGSLFPNVNAEVVVALQPDLVLAAGITNPDDVNALAEIGLTVFATRFTTGLEDIYADILDVGTLTGQTEQAEAVVADMRTRVDAVITQTQAAGEQPIVFYEIDATEPAKPWTTGPGTFIDSLITMAGGRNVSAGAAEQYFQISLEELVAQDPQIIVLGSFTFGGQTPETVAARDGWQDIDAVQNGTVYTFDDNLVSRPGPRVVDGLEALALLIHPELYE